MFARYKRCRENVITDDYENIKKVKKLNFCYKWEQWPWSLDGQFMCNTL